MKPRSVSLSLSDGKKARSGPGVSPRRVNKGVWPKLVLVVALLVWPLIVQGQYALTVMTTAGLFVILTLSLWVILGTAGQLSFGHSAFYGIGAYITGLLCTRLGVPTLLALVAGALGAGAVAVVIGRPVLKLKYFYLALATIGVSQIFLVILLMGGDVTGGSNGFTGIPDLNIFGFSVENFMRKYYVVWIVALVILLALERVGKYRVGRAWRALAASEIAASSLGLRIAQWKLRAFVISAVVCGIAGGLFAFVLNSVSPSSFTFTASILPIVMLLVGGQRSIWGAVIGGVIMTWIVNGFSSIQQYTGVAYSVILLLLLLLLPGGVLSALKPGQVAKLKAWLGRENVHQPDPIACAKAAEAGGTGAQCETSIGLPAISDDPPDATGIKPAMSMVADSASGSCACDAGDPVMELEGLSVFFGGLKAVKDVSLEVPKGQIVALIGPNGAGKTTVFNAVSRLEPLTAGRVSFLGRDISRMSAAEVSRLGLARTFQQIRLFAGMTVLENVMVGCHRHESSGFWAGMIGSPKQRAEERASRDRALDILAMLGLSDHSMQVASALPYGKQRLVEIARALASEPCLLLLDEPAAGMNASERAYLVDRIAKIREAGTTVLLVEHDMELVMGISDHVYVLDYGRLVSAGSPEKVQADPKVVEAYLGIQRDRERRLCSTPESRDGTCAELQELLVVEDLTAGYGPLVALHGVTLSVREGEVVAVLGGNGAGKTTLLHTVSGLIRSSGGKVSYGGKDTASMTAQTLVRMGMCQCLEGRQLFPGLTVEDNLVLGASGHRGGRKAMAEDIEFALELFPVLRDRRRQPAGTLSGGEQQMLAISRALMGRPKLLLLDEPSMGLAPLAVERIFEALATLNSMGLTMLMVEQNAEMALWLAHRALVLQNGRVALSGSADELRRSAHVRATYLGQAPAAAG